jgi:hypothetical protein
VAELTAKPLQDRFANRAAPAEANPTPARPTKTAEATVPTAAAAAAPAQ